MLNKINVFGIVKGHCNSLVDANKNKVGVDDYLTHLFIPLAVGILAYYINLPVKSSGINLIVTVFSIFVGLLINLVVLLFSVVNRKSLVSEQRDLLEEILYNILFGILVSIFTIVFSIGTFLYIKAKLPFSFLPIIALYSLITSFFITLLMVLKRLYLVFDHELKDTEATNLANPNEETKR